MRFHSESSLVLLASASLTVAVSAQKVNYTSLGCFNDRAERTALRLMEGLGYPQLDGNPKTRADAINKCAQVAKSRGENVFALQSGQCWSLSDVTNGDYARWGPASSCPSNGLGATLAAPNTNEINTNHVYRLDGVPDYKPDFNSLPYESVGCFLDNGKRRVIRDLEGSDPRLDGPFATRADAINKCYQVAASRNYTIFGVSGGGQCWGQLDNYPNGYYSFWGPTGRWCYRDGKGGLMTNHVYHIKNAPVASEVLRFEKKQYKPLGCWADFPSTGNKTLRWLETISPLLDSTAFPAFRPDAIEKCYQAAKARSYNVFGLSQYGCFGANDLINNGSYQTLGQGICFPDGRGGFNNNDMYQIVGGAEPITDYTNLPFKPLGCWSEASVGGTNSRTMTFIEGDPILDGHYYTRDDAIFKCADAAKARGHTIFAIQTGGMCLSAEGGEGYKRIGPGFFCPKDGLGWNGVNQVYSVVPQKRYCPRRPSA